MKSYGEPAKSFSGSVVVVSGDNLPVNGYKGELFYLDNVGLHISDGKYWIPVISANGGEIKGKLTVNSITATHLLEGNPTGNSNSSTKLYTSRKISAFGDATWSVEFDGSNDEASELSLSLTGVKPDTYKNVTVDEKGRVTSGFNYKIKTIAENYIAELSDEVIICNEELVLTLVPVKDKTYIIKRINAVGNVTIAGMIDGVNGYTLDKQYQSLTVISDGYVWYII